MLLQDHLVLGLQNQMNDMKPTYTIFAVHYCPASAVSRFGFRVSGFGLSILEAGGLDFIVFGFGFRVSGFGFGFLEAGSGADWCRLGVQCFRFRVPGFGVWDLMFRDSGFWFRVPVFGFRVSGFGFRISGFGFRVSSFGFRVSGFGFQVSGFRFRIWVSRFGFRVSGFGFRVSGFGFQVPGFGCQVSDSSFRIWGIRFRISGFGKRTSSTSDRPTIVLRGNPAVRSMIYRDTSHTRNSLFPPQGHHRALAIVVL